MTKLPIIEENPLVQTDKNPSKAQILFGKAQAKIKSPVTRSTLQTVKRIFMNHSLAILFILVLLLGFFSGFIINKLF